MARNDDLSSVMFEVRKQPVYVELEQPQQASLFNQPAERRNRFEPIPDMEAIVDVERQHVFSVVSSRYRLVTNAEAVALGLECMRQVLSKETTKEIEVFNIIMPSTRSFCHVDFIHRPGAFQPWNGDCWQPFLRVTNSYNRTKPLKFDIGFCRWICQNGMIFGKESIEFRYYHTKDAIHPAEEFRIDATRLKRLEARFIEKLHNLKRFYVPKESMFGIACKVFDVRFSASDRLKPKRWERLLDFRKSVADCTDRYFSEIGPNGYAALNVLTDCASRPVLYISGEAMIHSLQARSGDWMEEFLALIEDPSFDFEQYLGAYREQEAVLTA